MGDDLSALALFLDDGKVAALLHHPLARCHVLVPGETKERAGWARTRSYSSFVSLSRSKQRSSLHSHIYGVRGIASATTARIRSLPARKIASFAASRADRSSWSLIRSVFLAREQRLLVLRHPHPAPANNARQ